MSLLANHIPECHTFRHSLAPHALAEGSFPKYEILRPPFPMYQLRYIHKSPSPSRRQLKNEHQKRERLRVCALVSGSSQDSDRGVSSTRSSSGDGGGTDNFHDQACLWATAALWGTYPIALKILLGMEGSPNDPVLICALRFGMIAIASIALVRPEHLGPKIFSGRAGLAAFELGTLGVAGTLLNTASLAALPTIRVSILLSLVNILTPLLAAVIGKTAEERSISARAAFGCTLALLSTIYAIAGDSLSEASFSGPSIGDIEGILAAFFYSSTKVRIGSLAKEIEPNLLAAGRFVAQGLIACTIFVVGLAQSHATVISEWPNNNDLRQWSLLVFSSLISGMLATYLQTRGQRSVAPAVAQPIFATFTVWTTVFSCVILHETISKNDVVGGLGIALASVIASLDVNTLEKMRNRLPRIRSTLNRSSRRPSSAVTTLSPLSSTTTRSSPVSKSSRASDVYK